MRRSSQLALQVEGLAKCYRAGLPESPSLVHALRGVDAEVARGEMLGVTGGRGAGKSTLLLCAAGMLRPDAGTIRWFGEDRALFGRPHGVVYVAERPRYYPFLTAREALEHYAILHELPGRERGARVAAALADVGLAEHAGTQVRSLGAAMLQRLGVAQAVVARARLLLLDDALSTLPAGEGADIIALLERLRSDGAAIVLASRDASGVAEIADRVVALADGCVHATAGRVDRTDRELRPFEVERATRVAEGPRG